ncbi:MAG TPA: MSMEG_4193 family putative phosphomutase [Jiangellaceae bacterium]
MPTVLLVRHGRTTANATGVLAGRSAGVPLDDVGRAQVEALADRLTHLRLAAIVTSPLERCVETANALASGRRRLSPTTDERLVECGYGDWTGRPVDELRRTRLWRQVQSHPSAATFPGGESMRAMQARAVDAVRAHDALVAERAGRSSAWVAVSHGDVIKAVVADALGMHLDAFQRIVVDPASVTVITYTDLRPFVVHLNHTGAGLSAGPLRRRRRRSSDAEVGGERGSE